MNQEEVLTVGMVSWFPRRVPFVLAPGKTLGADPVIAAVETDMFPLLRMHNLAELAGAWARIVGESPARGAREPDGQILASTPGINLDITDTVGAFKYVVPAMVPGRMSGGYPVQPAEEMVTSPLKATLFSAGTARESEKIPGANLVSAAREPDGPTLKATLLQTVTLTLFLAVPAKAPERISGENCARDVKEAGGHDPWSPRQRNSRLPRNKNVFHHRQRLLVLLLTIKTDLNLTLPIK